MAKITGVEVLRRKVAPGDELLNEYTDEVVTVEWVRVRWNESVQIKCTSGVHTYFLYGDWNETVPLVTRKQPDYAPEWTQEEIKMGFNNF